MFGDSAVSSIGNGAIIPTIPGSPTNLTKDNTHITTDLVSFTWSAPEDDGGLPLSYSVEQYDETKENFEEVATVTQTSYTLTGLSENTSY